MGGIRGEGSADNRWDWVCRQTWHILLECVQRFRTPFVMLMLWMGLEITKIHAIYGKSRQSDDCTFPPLSPKYLISAAVTVTYSFMTLTLPLRILNCIACKHFTHYKPLLTRHPYPVALSPRCVMTSHITLLPHPT